MNSSLSSKTRALFFPIFSLLALIFLAVFLGNIFWTRINPALSDLSLANSESQLLSQKLSSLREIDQTILSQADSAYQAIPADNPMPIVLSQIRVIADELSVTLGNINLSISGDEATSVSKVIASFEATGTKENLVSLLSSLQQLSPLVNLEKVKIAEDGDNEQFKLTGSISSFWSPLPSELPALTEQISALSQQEADVLSELSGLKRPEFSKLTPANPVERSDPFNTEGEE